MLLDSFPMGKFTSVAFWFGDFGDKKYYVLVYESFYLFIFLSSFNTLNSM